MAKSTVEQRACGYRDGGIAALAGRNRRSSGPTIARATFLQLRARPGTGAPANGKVCMLRGKCLQRTAKDDLGVHISLSGVHGALHRLGYS